MRLQLITGVLLFVTMATISSELKGQDMADIEGNYSGYIYLKSNNEQEEVKVGLSVAMVGGNAYEAVLYFGGLPNKSEDPDEQKTVELRGTYSDYTLRLTGDFPLQFQYIHNRITALDTANTYSGHLEKVIDVISIH